MAKAKMAGEEKIAARVGSRIRKIREMRHISQLRLSQEIGIRSGPLGWIERGQHIPSGRVLYRIANALDVKLDDLFEEGGGSSSARGGSFDKPLDSFIMFPPLVTEAEPSSETVESTCLLCKSIAHLFGKILLAQDSLPRLPFHFGIPFVMSDASAEQTANLVRHHLGLGGSVTSDYLQVLESAGMDTIFLEMPEGIPALSGFNPLLNHAAIFINNRYGRKPEAQLFALFMEIGRLFWRVNAMAAEKRASGKLAIRLDEVTFANRFATYFMLPTSSLLRTAGTLGVSPDKWTWELFLFVKYRYSVTARQLLDRLNELPFTRDDGETSSELETTLSAFEKEHPGEEPGGHREMLFGNGRISAMVFMAKTRKCIKDRELAQLLKLLQQTRVKLAF
jgi:transcriptional regulator with XRE-family HTH domain